MQGALGPYPKSQISWAQPCTLIPASGRGKQEDQKCKINIEASLGYMRLLQKSDK